ncbi:hypothetical protein AGMMS50276_31420 [Synergistales bacterium]|nr:hypothetical protein AGMMS50276_31420 [Synergistales bacterium]
MPLQTEKDAQILWVCGESVDAIYFDRNTNADKVINILKEYGITSIDEIEIHFILIELLNLITESEDSQTIQTWMSNSLNVWPFTARNYASDIYDYLERENLSIDADKLVGYTKYLAHVEYEENGGIPVLLSDNSLYFRDRDKRELVTPINLDKDTGWQNIFGSEKDRAHLAVMSSLYLDAEGNDSLGITEFLEATPFPNFPSEIADKATLETLRNNNPTVHYLIKSENIYHTTDTLRDLTKTPVLSKSMVNWIKAKLEYKTISREGKNIITPEGCVLNYRELHDFLLTKPWLHTNKGYFIPNEVYLQRAEIQEIFGDVVPYTDAPESVCEFLNVITSLTSDGLIKALRNYSKKETVDAAIIIEIYQQLSQRNVDNNIFRKEKLILVSKDENHPIWATSGEVIWLDRADTFDTDYYYLQRFYSNELEHFFVDKLVIPKDADTHSYTNLWLKMQKQPYDEQKIPQTVKRVYQKILEYIKGKEFDDNLDWWKCFYANARFLAVTNTFEYSQNLFIADDGELEEIFMDEIKYLHIPDDKHTQYRPLFEAFRIPVLSKSISTRLSEFERQDIARRDKGAFLSTAAKALICIKLYNHDEYRKHYYYMRDKGILNQFLESYEYSGSGWDVEYLLLREKIRISKINKKAVYWDGGNHSLLVADYADKSDVADTFAQALTLPGSNDSRKISDCIEVCLEKVSHEKDIKKNKWEIPQEVIDWLDKNYDSSSEDDFAVEAQTQDDKESSVCKQDGGVNVASLQVAAANHEERPTIADNAKSSQTNDNPLQSQNRNDGEIFNRNGININASYANIKHEKLSYVYPEGSASEEEDSDPETLKKKMATEAVARKAVCDYETEHGRYPKEMPLDWPGYDIESKNNEDEPIRYIEIKSSKQSWGNYFRPLLSNTQIQCAMEHKDRYWLYVVENALDDNQRKIYAINNPFSKIGKFAFDPIFPPSVTTFQ